LKRFLPVMISVFLLALLSSCGKTEDRNKATSAAALGKVLAKVNGVPITEYDLRLSLKRVPHGSETSVESAKGALEALVRGELVYQKAVELGLGRNPAYLEKLAEVEAQVRAFQRQEMSVLFKEHVRNEAKPTDAEVQEYFRKNANRIQTTYHVWQIYYRGSESMIAKDYQDIKAGMPFEKVAARRFPDLSKLPKGMRAPWDLGTLRWNQVPAPWKSALDSMKPGQVSDIIRGPSERFWVIKLVDRTVDPSITFAAEKGNIIEILQRQKAEELYETTLGQMRGKSKITYTKQGGGP
jgi:EpsD family peptidyl-prolyl cis-trans isomerase